MGAWLSSAWVQVWPNLAANVLWVPLVWIHHRVMSRRVQALHQHVTALHEQLNLRPADVRPASKGL